jgi:hypothetical protein
MPVRSPCFLCVCMSAYPPNFWFAMRSVYGSMTNNKRFWIGWLDLLIPSLQYLLITINYKNSQSIFSRNPLPLLPRTRSILILVLWLAMDICEPHRKHHFLYCFIYSALHSNWSYQIVACVFVAARMFLQSRCPATGLHVTVSKESRRYFFPTLLVILSSHLPLRI